MNQHYKAADEWKKLSILARKIQIQEPKEQEIDRMDLALLKD